MNREETLEAIRDDAPPAVLDAVGQQQAVAEIEATESKLAIEMAASASDLATPAKPVDRWAAGRWLLSALVAIVLHGAVATLMLHWEEVAGASQPSEPIMIDLAPVAPAPATVPETTSLESPDLTPDTLEKMAENISPEPPVQEPIAEKVEPVEPKQLQPSEEKPQQPQEIQHPEQPAPVIAEIEQKSDVELPPKKEEAIKPAQKRPEAKRTPSRERAKPEPEKVGAATASRSQTARVAAAASGAPSGGPSPSDWKSQVIGILERNKRYPAAAESKHEQGTAHLAFTINRQGHVTSAHIAGSSGSPALDAETLSLVHRVSFPPPPAEMAGAQISLVVSLRYNIR